MVKLVNISFVVSMIYNLAIFLVGFAGQGFLKKDSPAWLNFGARPAAPGSHPPSREHTHAAANVPTINIIITHAD